MDFRQTAPPNSDKDELVRFLDQKVKGQGHQHVKSTRNTTVGGRRNTEFDADVKHVNLHA